MANCGKCHAELIGSGKFCATCGAPVPSLPAGTSPAAGSSANVAIDTGAYAPPSQVNPFAATASPSSVSVVNRGGPTSAPLTTGEPVAPAKPEATSGSSAAQAAPPPAEPEARSPSVAPAQSPSVAPSTSGSRPPVGIDATPSQLSPLAVSNAISHRGAFQQAVQAVEEARAKQASVAPPAPAAAPKAKKPGTQLMAPAAKPQGGAVAKPAAPKGGRTVAMPYNAAAMAMLAKGQMPPRSVGPGGQPSGVQPSGAQPGPAAPSSIVQSSQPAGNAPMPQSVLQPSSVQPSANLPAPQSVLQPVSSGVMHPSHAQPIGQPAPQGPYAAPHPPAPQGAYPQAQPFPYGQQPPAAAPGAWGWAQQQPSAVQPPPQPGGYGAGYGFGFPPGSRVHVTWSNGQRYPATVSQVNGTQCLVVFPDGQQHWVEVQFLSPG